MPASIAVFVCLPFVSSLTRLKRPERPRAELWRGACAAGRRARFQSAAGATVWEAAMAVEGGFAQGPGLGKARLTYFRGWGLAEQVRWVLSAAGAEWEQVGLETNEQFEALKKGGRLLFGQLPLLEIDGLELVQSQAMVRHVARRAGLSGKTPAEEALCDMVAEAVKDARGPAVSYPFAAAADRAAHVEEKVLPAARKFLPRAEMILERSGSGGVLPSGMCYADVLLAELIEVLRGMGVDSCVEGYPLLAALHGRVVALPGVAAYLAGPKRFPFPDGQVADMYKANVAKVLGW